MAEDRGNYLRGGQCKPIEVEELYKRLDRLYYHWDVHHKLSDLLLLQTPATYTGMRIAKSSVFCVWLFGLEFPEIMFVFSKTTIYILCNKYNMELLQVLEKATTKCARPLSLKVYTQATEMFSGIRESVKKTYIRLGYVEQSLLFDRWKAENDTSDLEITDVTSDFSKLFVVKEKYEVGFIEQSAYLNYTVMDEFVVSALLEIVKCNGTITHSGFTEEIMGGILRPKLLNISDVIKEERINVPCRPVVQSGYDFDLSPDAQSSDSDLVFENSDSIVVCIISSSYSEYHSYLARTFFLNPSRALRDVYEILVEAECEVIETLKVGRKLSDAYKAGQDVVRRRHLGLLPFLTKTAGMGIGLEHGEPNLTLDDKNDKKVESGMAFKVILGFEQLNNDGKAFSMLLGDTVIVDSGNPTCVTASWKETDYVTYPFTPNVCYSKKVKETLSR